MIKEVIAKENFSYIYMLISVVGDVGDVYIPRDRFTRESRGFAFVRYYDKRDAEDALEAMDGTIMDGRELRVQMARYGRPTEPYRRGPPRSRYGGGRYGRFVSLGTVVKRGYNLAKLFS